MINQTLLNVATPVVENSHFKGALPWSIKGIQILASSSLGLEDNFSPLLLVKLRVKGESSLTSGPHPNLNQNIGRGF